MASHDFNHNPPYQEIPGNSEEADAGHYYEYSHHEYYELGRIPDSVNGSNHDDHFRSLHQNDNAFHPQMDTYDLTMKGRPNNTTIRKYTTSSDENHQTALPTWLPYTLRWQSLSALLAFTLILELMVAIVHALSSRDSGLVDDNGSGGTVVASKFIPTVLAVIDVFLISILLNDVRRTQAFAQLASPVGAPAKTSLTWTADAWWDTLVQGLPNRQRRTNWALLCAAIAFIFGFLIISPFSSSLFVTQDILFVHEEPFKRLDISAILPLQASPLAVTYFRTVSNILQNVTTSAWVTDKYAILPVWPARVNSVPLGPSFSDSMQTWSAMTTVFDVEMNCEQINYEKSRVVPYKTNPTLTNYSSVLLSSSSGCALNVTTSGTFQSYGGAVWESLANVTVDDNTPYVDYGPAYTKTGCSQDEFLIITTPWPGNVTMGNFTMTGQICNARYYTGDANATVAFDQGNSQVQVQINESQYLSNRVPIPGPTANLASFQDAFLSQNWTTHLQKPSQSQRIYSSGPAALLSALYNFSPTQLLDDPSILQNAARLKQRFFGELLRDKFDESSFQSPINLTGSTTESRRRVVVVSAVAILLEVTLVIQLVLLIAIFFTTRLYNRPLGLFTDPTPAMSVAKLIAREPDTLRSFEGLHSNTNEEIATTLSDQRYQLTHGRIHLIAPEGGVADLSDPSTPQDFTKQERMASTASKPQSFTFGLWVLILLTLLLSATLVAIAYLYWYSGTYGLYQTAFVYAFNVSIGGVNLRDINPASIVTTFIAVFLGLWWGSLDTTLRRIQPYLTLAKAPTAGKEGLLVSYISSYLLWASWKALTRRHWVLFAVCTGAFFAEIFTISMSSMWQRGPGGVPFTVDAPRQLELRNVPMLTTGREQFTSHAGNYKQTALADLFNSMRTSWIYGAAIQTSLNGSEPAWSSDGWTFVPIDLTSLPQTTVQNTGNQTAQARMSMNVTVDTSGIRARLECSPFEHLNLEDSGNWLTEWDLTNPVQWDQKHNPDILKHGYELGLSTLGNNTNLYLDQTPSNQGNYTTFFVNNKRLQCCQNMTDGQIGPSSVGYWSPNLRNGTFYPDFAKSWPANFTVKWIHGFPVEGYQGNGTGHSGETSPRLIWSEKPQMSALNCMPIIERANASVTVSAGDSHVINYDLIGDPQPDPFAWTDDFTQHKYDPSCSQCDPFALNITTSYGVLFMTGLLGAADLSDFSGTDTDSWVISSENIDDQTFNIREPGLNADLMTYSMLSLANNDHEALLDLGTLQRTAQQTFSALFQNFASNNITFDSGGYVFQSPNEKLPVDLDGPGTGPSADVAPPMSTIITLHVSRPVELLEMSKPAAWICMIILGYLIVASVILTIVSRRYTKTLLRKIDSIADVAVLMAGSEKLLNVARERSREELKNDRDTKAELGWFTGTDGTLRWGIEIVGGSVEKEVPNTPPDRSHQWTSTTNDIPVIVGGTEHSPPGYDAEGVSLLSSTGSHNRGQAHHDGHTTWREGGDLGVERVSLSPSPVSQEYGSQTYQAWQDPHEEYHVPPLREERAPSIDLNVDETPFSTYFANRQSLRPTNPNQRHEF